MTGPLDDLEQELTALLEERAERLGESIPPIAWLVAKGNAAARKQRSARTWVAVGVAAAVAAVVAIPALIVHGNDHAGPLPPTASHSSGDGSGVPTTPTTLPYLDGKVLHIGDRTVTLDAQPRVFISHGDTTIYWDANSERWWRVWARDGSVERFGLPRSNDRNAPWKGTYHVEVSADGRITAVMTHPTETTTRITEYDAEGQEEIGHVDLDQAFTNWTGGGDSVTLTGVNDDGRVYWNQTDKHDTWWTWDPASSAPVRLDADLNFGPYPPNAAIAADSVVTTVAADGTTRPDARVPGSAEIATTLWSPSGSIMATLRMASGPSGDGPALIDLDRGTEPVRPPADFSVLKWFGFESDAYVIGAAAVDHRPASLVRCSTQRSACTVIGELPTGWESWEWATSPPAEIATDPVTAPAHHDASTTTTDPIAALPQGAPASIPTLSGGVVRLRDQTIADQVGAVRASNDRTTLLLARLDGGVTLWSTTTGAKTLTGAQSDPVSPVISPDGRYAVTAYHDTIEEWSLPDGRLVGSLPYSNAILEVLAFMGVDNTGRLYATTFAPRGGFTWRPGSAKAPLTGIAAEFAVSGIGGVGPHGVVAPPSCDGATGGISPSGTLALCDLGGGRGFGIGPVDGGPGTVLGLPADLPHQRVRAVGFESDGAALVTAKMRGASAWLLRCPTDGGTCERVGEVPRNTYLPLLPGSS